MRKFFIFVSVAAAVVFLVPEAAAGGSVLEWDRFAYTPGEVAVAEGSFGRGCCGRGTPDDGPFYVYAFRGGWPRDGEPFVPDDGILLGRIEVVDTENRHELWTGRLEFTVPDLPPGIYGVTHCNDPCTTMLGDVVHFPLRIVESETEARLLKKIDDLRTAVDAHRSRIAQLGTQVRRQAAEAERRAAELQSRIEELERALARRDAPVRESNLVPWVIAIAALALAGAEAGILGAMGKRR